MWLRRADRSWCCSEDVTRVTDKDGDGGARGKQIPTVTGLESKRGQISNFVPSGNQWGLKPGVLRARKELCYSWR